jgi:hypothetical protein
MRASHPQTYDEAVAPNTAHGVAGSERATKPYAFDPGSTRLLRVDVAEGVART